MYQVVKRDGKIVDFNLSTDFREGNSIHRTFIHAHSTSYTISDEYGSSYDQIAFFRFNNTFDTNYVDWTHVNTLLAHDTVSM